jgi:hypothetical protein
MFDASDERFAEVAVDPERRLSAIRDLSWRRTILFWCAVVASLVCLPIPYLSGSHAIGAGSAFAPAVMWILALKFDTDLKILQVVNRLHQN